MIAEGEVMQLAAAKNTDDDRGRVSRGHQRQDGGAVLRRGRGGRRHRQARRRRAGGAADPTAAISGSPSSWSTTRSTIRRQPADLGKAVGDDFREGKITLPVILSFRRGSEDERAFWTRTIAEGQIEDGDLERAVALMKQHKAIEATLERARSYGAVAHDAIDLDESCGLTTTRDRLQMNRSGSG